ncbi:carboxylesterase family protein [Paenibacillus sp. alder61]|nr:carboxylesterase family protein [Paenibacillus sp. alder61]
MNYRLGPFGWLSLSQYGGVFADATNLGLQDIITALRWVQENIARFGGDSGRLVGYQRDRAIRPGQHRQPC